MESGSPSSQQTSINGRNTNTRRCNSKNSIGRNRDMISTLPETLLHHIFSFLDMKFVVQTSVLSKRWRYLWASLPSLNFDVRYFSSPDDDEVVPEDCKKFMDFVDRVMLLRNDSYIRKINFFCDPCFENNRIETLILAAVRRKVQELVLEISVDEVFELPHCVFSASGEIRVLKLVVRNIEISPVLMPSPIGLIGGLRTLYLDSVGFPDGDLDGKLHLHFPVLESLTMIKCEIEHLRILSILAHRLKEWSMDQNEDSSTLEIKLLAPYLESLKCTCWVLTTYSLESFFSLESANIKMNGGGFWQQKENCVERTVKFLWMLRNAKSLMFSGCLLEVLLEASDVLEQMLTPFSSLRHLKLEIPLNSAFMHSIGCLLKKSPCIESLVLEITEDSSDVIANRKTVPMQCMLSTLKSAEIKNVRGHEEELEFMQFLLKNAMILERMIIITPKISSRDTNNLMEFSEKLLKLPRASSSIGILVHILSNEYH